MFGKFVGSNSDDDDFDNAMLLTQFRNDDEEPFLPEHFQLRLDDFECLTTLDTALKRFTKNKMITDSFRSALNKLRIDLRTDIQSQIDKGESELKIQQSSAVRIAEQTKSLLSSLQSNFKPEIKLQAFYKFEKNCKQTSGWKTFGNTIKTVIFTGVGMVLGATIGAGVGFAVGAWAGPGALVTAAIGLTKGIITGASVGIAAGAALGGVTACTTSSCLFFKRTPLERDLNQVIKTGKNALQADQEMKRKNEEKVKKAAASKQAMRGRR